MVNYLKLFLGQRIATSDHGSFKNLRKPQWEPQNLLLLRNSLPPSHVRRWQEQNLLDSVKTLGNRGI